MNSSKALLTDQVTRVLKFATCDLYREKKDRCRLRADDVRGALETDWDTHSVGACTGVLFRATVECDEGEYQVNFLLNTDDLKRGARVLRTLISKGAVVNTEITEQIPCEELYRFQDLRGSSRTLN